MSKPYSDYRATKSKKQNKFTNAMFFEEFTSFLQDQMSTSDDLVIVSDIHIHLHKPLETDPSWFLTLSTINNTLLHQLIVLATLLKVMFPPRNKTVTIRQTQPWFSDALYEAKSDKWFAEQRWRLTSLTVHKDIYHD